MILITGHRGYIGSSLFSLIEAHYPVVGYDIVDGQDLMDLCELRRVLHLYRPKIVIHLAALSSVPECERNFKKAVSVNAVGTRNLLTVMNEVGCNRIIYTSTSAVYAPSTNVLHECMPLGPISVYGVTKQLGELIVRSSQINYLILRLFNVAGRTEVTTSMGTDRLFSALPTGKLTVYGSHYPTADGTAERDYVSLRDTCRAYLRAVRCLDNNIYLSSRIFNICRGIPISVRYIIKWWRYHVGPIALTLGSARAGDPMRVLGQRGAAAELGWLPEQGLEEIIASFVSKEKNTY